MKFTFTHKLLTPLIALTVLLTGARGQVVLNEFNAVSGSNFLGGGSGVTTTPADPFFGRVEGNGGDWFEIVVIGDGTPGTVDMSGWRFEVADVDDENDPSSTFVADGFFELTSNAFWTSVPTGTIITFTEDNSFNGGADTRINRVDRRTTEGWSHSNFFLEDSRYIENLDRFGINANETRVRILNAAGTVVYGPAGEPSSTNGVEATNVFQLQANPSTAVTATNQSIHGVSTNSTFGEPNQSTTTQDFTAFTQVVLTPVFTSTQDDATIAFGETFTYNITVNDSDGDSVTITGTGLPDWLTLTDNGNSTATLTGTPAQSDDGTSSITLRADDGDDGTGTQTFSITVNEEGSANTANAIIYKGFLKRASTTNINYRFYDKCFVIIPAAGGVGEVIFYTDYRGEKTYNQMSISYSVAKRKGTRRGIMSATNVADGAMTSFIALGTPSRTHTAGEERFKVPSSLKGHLLSAGDATYEGARGVRGFAGQMDIRMSYQKTESRSFATQGFDVTQAVNSVINGLTADGFVSADVSPNTEVDATTATTTN